MLRLALVERLVLFSALPKEGSFDTVRLVRQLRERLALTEAERTESNFRYEAGDDPRWLWDQQIEKDFTLSPGAVQLLRQGLETVAAKQQAQDLHLSLYERLSANGGPPEGTQDAGGE